MAEPNVSICSPWATIADVGSPCDDYAFDTAVLEEGLQVASEVLFNLTGKRWPGECSETVRPCGYRTSGVWTPLGYGWCGCLRSRDCGCRRLSELVLPGHPVVEVSEVKIDGVIVDPARYRVDDYRLLVYLPEDDDADRQGWPCCQRLDRPDTDEDTWSVTYSFGTLPPDGGVMAAAALGCQLALAKQPETVGACRLPKRVQSIVRQGITMAVLDPLDLFAEGRTGVPEVDLWVGSILQGDKRRRAGFSWVGHRVQSIRRTNT